MVCCYSTASPFQQTTRTFSSHLLTFLINELSKIVRNKTEDISKPFHKRKLRKKYVNRHYANIIFLEWICADPSKSTRRTHVQINLPIKSKMVACVSHLIQGPYSRWRAPEHARPRLGDLRVSSAGGIATQPAPRPGSLPCPYFCPGLPRAVVLAGCQCFHLALLLTLFRLIL